MRKGNRFSLGKENNLWFTSFKILRNFKKIYSNLVKFFEKQCHRPYL